jgi:hypothetical protein
MVSPEVAIAKVKPSSMDVSRAPDRRDLPSLASGPAARTLILGKSARILGQSARRQKALEARRRKG